MKEIINFLNVFKINHIIKIIWIKERLSFRFVIYRNTNIHHRLRYFNLEFKDRIHHSYIENFRKTIHFSKMYQKLHWDRFDQWLFLSKLKKKNIYIYMTTELEYHNYQIWVIRKSKKTSERVSLINFLLVIELYVIFD